MSGAVNTQAAEFPADGELPTVQEAGDFRDIDLTGLVPSKSTEFATTLNTEMHKPTDSRAEMREGRRVYANGPEAAVALVTSSDGARSYSSRTAYCAPGVGDYAGPPTLLLGDDAARQRVVITNSHGTDNVLIGPLGQVANGAGFVLPPGNLFETTVTAEIYAAVPVGGIEAVNVGVWSESA